MAGSLCTLSKQQWAVKNAKISPSCNHVPGSCFQTYFWSFHVSCSTVERCSFAGKVSCSRSGWTVPARVGLVPRWGAEGQSSACSKTSASELQRPIKIEIVQTSGAATQDFPGREGKGCTWAGTWVSGSGFPSCGDLNLNPKRGCSSNGLATKYFPSFREDDKNSKWPSSVLFILL